jgi:hypothetical protein
MSRTFKDIERLPKRAQETLKRRTRARLRVREWKRRPLGSELLALERLR